VDDGDVALREDEVSARELVDCCLSFITHDLSTGKVHFIHPSVQRWFDNEPQRQKLLPPSYLAKTCLTYLNFNVFDAPFIDSVTDQAYYTNPPPMDQIERHLTLHPFYRYAARFWATHTKDAELEPAVQMAAFAFLAAENRRELMLRTGVWVTDWSDDREPIYTIMGETPLQIIAGRGLVVLCNLLLNGNSR
jgi:hypothetical protein